MTKKTEVTQETIDIASSLMYSAPTDMGHEPTDEQLALLACGWLSDEQASDVIEALTTSPKLRARLLELRSHVAYAEEGPASQKRILESEPTLSKVFGQILAVSFKAFSDWDKACSDAFQGQNACPAVWGSLRELWESIQSQKRVIRVAANRSGPSSRSVTRAKVVVFPGEETADLFVERDENDVLHAFARFTRPYQHPREICLYMQEEGSGWVRLGGSLTDGSEWRCSIPYISRALDIPAGPLETHYFAITEGRWKGEKRTVLLRMTESLSRPDYSRFIRLELRGAAGVRDSRFYMTVVIPDEIRNEFASGRLDAGIQLSPSTYIVLGAWKVADLEDGSEVELSCPMPVPDIPDCELDYHAGLRLSLGNA